MKIRGIFIIFSIMLILTFGCKSSQTTKADAANATGGDKKVYILIDRTLEEESSGREQQQYQQLIFNMERSLQRMLSRAKYKATPIEDKDAYVSSSDNCLVVVKIVKYNPGSAAKRAVIGFGAGTCSLDVNYEIFGENSKSLLNKNTGYASSRDWRYIIEKINAEIRDAVRTTFR